MSITKYQPTRNYSLVNVPRFSPITNAISKPVMNGRYQAIYTPRVNPVYTPQVSPPKNP
jgi:hypothetical protein